LGFEIFNQMKRQAKIHPEMPHSEIIRNEKQSAPSYELTDLPERATRKRELTR
jgi:hypothetical protein